jgi:S-adenosylmethionine/arginine decarboxylase-like enzyme
MKFKYLTMRSKIISHDLYTHLLSKVQENQQNQNVVKKIITSPVRKIKYLTTRSSLSKFGEVQGEK